jgi:hypothetical protein
MKTLNVIQPNEVRYFYSSLHPNLARTGTIGDGSCFFHAMAWSLEPTYPDMDTTEKIKMVNSIRKLTSKSLDVDAFKKLGKGSIYRLLMTEAISECIDDDDRESVNIDLSNKWSSTEVDDCLPIVEPHGVSKTDLESLEKSTLDIFVQHIENDYVDEFCIEHISNVFDINILILYGPTREPYSYHHDIKVGKRTIIILYIDEHYESIGVLYRNNGSNDLLISRMFNFDDVLIRRILEYYK